MLVRSGAYSTRVKKRFIDYLEFSDENAAKIVSEKRGESRLRVDLFFPLQRDYSKEVINIKAKFFISNDVFSMINNKSSRTSFEVFPLIGNDITKSSTLD